MSKGSARDSATEPLPRRGADNAGRIPTQYGPGNPVSDRLKRHQFRVRPGAPDFVAAQPKPGAEPAAGAVPGFTIRPGTPADAGRTQGQQLFEAPADRKTRQDHRRRLLWLGTALVALIGLVAACVGLLTGHSAPRTAAPAPVRSTLPAQPLPGSDPPGTPVASPGTSAPAPTTAAPDPVALISDAGTDTAPLGAATLFPGRSVTVHGHSYTQALTAASACAAAATPPLAAVLGRNGCRQVFRASYSNGTTAVTVGVAVFDTAAQATAVKQQALAGNLEPLSGGALPAFCHAVACRLSVNAFGRYAYFTVAGYTTGKPVPATDGTALAAGADLGALAFDSLASRARAEAVAAAH